KISPEESNCLAGEKQQALRLQGRLREKIELAIKSGTGYFRGLSRDGAGLGKSIREVFHELFNQFVPELYSKLEMGAKPLPEHAAEEILKAANLSGLAPVFYESGGGYGLVARDGTRYIPNPSAPLAKEILDFIRQRTSFGEKVTGKDLEQRFL